MTPVNDWTAMRWALTGLLAFSAPVAAVEISPSGEGGALVFPIWATTNGHLSVLSVVDSQYHSSFAGLPSQAVKMLLRDAQGGVLFSANLYLRNREDTWTASITPLPDGRSRLASSDGSCVLVGESGDAVEPWSGSVDLDADHGFIEFIVMASFRLAWTDGSCVGLASRWNGGVWSQDPGIDLNEQHHTAALRGTLNLVNVQKGTSYTIPATALREFSDIPQHTAPNSVLPDLASAHDSGTSANATRSRVCDARSCVESTWALPRDAVAAALLASELRGDYSNSPTLAGKTDLVFSYPLRHHLAEGSSALGYAWVELATFDRSGARTGWEYGICSPAPPNGCVFEHPWSMSSMSNMVVGSFLFGGDASELQPSEVLGIEQTSLPSFSQPPPAEGAVVGSSYWRVTSREGHVYQGLPVIGVVLQQFENGNLIGPDDVPQRANYGVAVPMTRRMVWP